ncbi:hypothetical protein SAMN05192529_102166 [Arachidicoccus rhizosphaerae]|uniref:Uncharacterized protein n=1 Tax=Arachidicoccus rhizosphaerae TaxID=551991 RepID=A0A1H3W649_9BACT|nr:hypothetical protein SAMN05192529_102166 [Arachidicoccus rhizosphaerae]
MPFKLQFGTDLHLELPANKGFVMRHSLPHEGKIMVQAGDIMPFSVMSQHKDFLLMRLTMLKLHTGYLAIMSITISIWLQKVVYYMKKSLVIYF